MDCIRSEFISIEGNVRRLDDNGLIRLHLKDNIPVSQWGAIQMFSSECTIIFLSILLMFLWRTMYQQDNIRNNNESNACSYRTVIVPYWCMSEVNNLGNQSSSYHRNHILKYLVRLKLETKLSANSEAKSKFKIRKEPRVFKPLRKSKGHNILLILRYTTLKIRGHPNVRIEVRV